MDFSYQHKFGVSPVGCYSQNLRSDFCTYMPPYTSVQEPETGSSEPITITNTHSALSDARQSGQ